LCGFQEFRDFFAQLRDPMEFVGVGLATAEKLTVLPEKCRHVALQILNFEVARCILARGCFPFLLYCWGLFLLNQRDAPRSFGRRILLIGFSVRAPIER